MTKKGIKILTVFIVSIFIITFFYPKIILVGEKNHSLCPGDYYEEDGYKAKIGMFDITEHVKVVENKNNISYRLGYRNLFLQTKRHLIYEDKMKPEIALKNNSELIIDEIDDYIEYGIEIVDNCDKDLSNNIEIINNIKKDNQVIYKVTDSAGNENEIVRTVKIEPRPNNGIIYLTFDDGPAEGNTNLILDILKKHNVKATFFVTGLGPDYLIKRIVDEHHTIAIHTYSHDYAYVYTSVDNYFKDLERVKKRIMDITGVDPKIVRLPGGGSNTISRRYKKGVVTEIVNELKVRGYKYYDWSVDSGDAMTSNPKVVYNNFVNQLKPKRENNVLMHDTKIHTRKALEDIIKYGKSKNFKFKRITNSTEEVHHKVAN